MQRATFSENFLTFAYSSFISLTSEWRLTAAPLRWMRYGGLFGLVKIYFITRASSAFMASRLMGFTIRPRKPYRSKWAITGSLE